MKGKSVLLALLGFVAISINAYAEPTDITVRVKSKGAKFVGTSMGGALVTIKNEQTGELLAKGLTLGSTGDTDLIMRTPQERGAAISDETSAHFTATLDIDRPVYAEITAYGPMAQKQSANRVSATQWIVPGKDITGGDAFFMELPGLVVDVRDPAAHTKLSGKSKIDIKANVTPMCGCPITPDGLWDSNQYEVRAIVLRDNEEVGDFPLDFAGETSQFSGRFSPDKKGVYQAIVYGFNPANGNTGLDRVTFMVN
ncbi:MAG: hypothetical protein ACLFV2_09420 [Desulfurivibrionaceae bacterium]